MKAPLIIFHHGLFAIGKPPRVIPRAVEIAREQMRALKSSGLLASASEIYVGLNGGAESEALAKQIFPSKSQIMYHGTDCHNENPTILALWERAKAVKGRTYFLYEHQKGSSKTNQDDIAHSDNWRRTMERDLVHNWRQCVQLLSTYDIVCSHWKWNVADGTQSIPAGNMLWITSDFAAKLPSMHLRARIKQDGIGALSSRYEAEVFWGNGPRPRVYQFRHDGFGMP